MIPLEEIKEKYNGWYQEAKEMKLDKLQEFISNMAIKRHNYSDECYAMAYAALATLFAMNKEFGITGFQAGQVMWEIIGKWMYPSNKCGLKLIDFDEMLYPQYENKFRGEIDSEVWYNLREEARRLLDKDSGYAVERVVRHWQSIVDYHIPFGYGIKDGRE